VAIWLSPCLTIHVIIVALNSVLLSPDFDCLSEALSVALPVSNGEMMHCLAVLLPWPWRIASAHARGRVCGGCACGLCCRCVNLLLSACDGWIPWVFCGS
jgi:hypothetical protein